MSFCLYNYDKEEHRCSMQMVFQINHAVTGFIHGKIQTAWGHCSGFPWCCAARGALRIQSDTEPQADEDITTQYHRCIMMYQMLSKVNHPKNDLLPVQELLVYSIYIYTLYIYIYTRICIYVILSTHVNLVCLIWTIPAPSQDWVKSFPQIPQIHDFHNQKWRTVKPVFEVL